MWFHLLVNKVLCLSSSSSSSSGGGGGAGAGAYKGINLKVYIRRVRQVLLPQWRRTETSNRIG